MRIAQLMLGKGFGGAERSFVDLTNVLSDQGHELLVIVNRKGVSAPKINKGRNVNLVSVSCLGTWDCLSRVAIYRHFERFLPQIVHTHLARASAIGGKAASDLGIHTVAKSHNLINPKYYRFVDRIVPTTRAQQSHLLKNGVSKERICLIPNFSTVNPVSKLTIAGKQKTFSQREFVLRAAGRLVHKKGFDIFLEAVFFLKSLNMKLRVEIAGDGPEREALLTHRKLLGLEKEVSFLGWRENIVDFIEGADLFVLPSRQEPFGVVLLEAMASGTPIVATETQGPEEIFQSGGAILCDVGSPEDLAKAISFSLSNSSRWEMALKALQMYRDCYSAGIVVGRYLELYKTLLGIEPS